MSDQLTATAANYAVVTKSDTTDLGPVRALWVGGTGAVSVSTGLTGAGVVFASVPTGSILPVACRRVLSTGTDATLIVALY
jgi:hypothetical protein